MVLAAGYGSRLRPLTAGLPKPLVPVGNRPLLWYLLHHLRQAGIHEVVINLHYRGDQIRQWLGSGISLGMEVTYSEESVLLGSAGGARGVRDFFGNEPALILHGDLLFDIDLREVIQYHLSRQALATLVLHPAHPRFNYGRIMVNPQGEIAQFVNQHAPWVSGPLTETIFTGVQVLDPRLLNSSAAQGFSVLTTDLYPHLLTPASRMFGFLIQGYWSDIGTPIRYWEANMDVASGRVASAEVMLAQAAEPGGPPQGEWMGEGAAHSSVLFGPDVSLGARCQLGAGTILGEGCRLADGVRIGHSVLWSGVCVERQATIERSIVLSDVVVPAGSSLVRKIVSPSGITEL
jgi:mannose-1-phosphate guanylyltransferase/phosphomannomutase